MAKEYNENGEYFEFSVTELSGDGEGTIHTYNDSKEAAKLLLSSSDKKDIKKFDDAIERIIKTGEDQYMTLDVDYILGDGERYKNRCKVMISLEYGFI